VCASLGEVSHLCVVVGQSGSPRDMIFSIPQIIAAVVARVCGWGRGREPCAEWVSMRQVSHVHTLEPGDLILTGTPEGVGPVYPGGWRTFPERSVCVILTCRGRDSRWHQRARSYYFGSCDPSTRGLNRPAARCHSRSLEIPGCGASPPFGQLTMDQKRDPNRRRMLARTRRGGGGCGNR
jgi:hypothetical protein